MTTFPGSGPERPNILLISSDQHHPRMAGFAGSTLAQTPNLDDLAARGTTFTQAYSTSPICVPARASMATGRYVHELGTWDNSAPYVGTPPSWGHVLAGAGYRVTTIGKLHYRDSSDDTGFPDQRLAMHVHGLGDIKGVSLRPEGRVPARPDAALSSNLLDVGEGESEYTRFDRSVAAAAVEFLERESSEGPWALMVSFVAPHFPLVAPREHFDRYDPADLPGPVEGDEAWDHPAVTTFKAAFGLTRPLTDGEHRRALHAYLALCSFLDERVGDVLRALERSGRVEDTVVVYTSDHGESAGAHGLWFKHLLNEESVGVPMVVAGPGVAGGGIIDTPVSHVDLFPTFLDAAGLGAAAPDDAPGLSLLDTGRLALADRAILAEYHANGSTSASFMLRHGRLKYIEYVGDRPQLFDLVVDPAEEIDLARLPDAAPLLERCAARLREICDPEAVDAAAKADQARRVEEVGGVEGAAAHTVNHTPVPTAGG
jgi:choline-sulfatase